ncbi:MAG: tetratricopeptide repeat protein [Bacteroidaceae bacterium]|nr:tetratricopeptide repeat protein [Bacteroidaceae bacterium]
MGRNALYFEDYVLAIQRFNMVINAKPWLGEPYFYRSLAKYYLEDYQGAEIDCGVALERNPYMCNYYQLRALCRINQARYELASQDYVQALKINPLEKSCWHNLVLSYIELKQYEKADSALDVMIQHWPKIPEQMTLKAQVALLRTDTIAAEKWVDRALELNEYEGNAWRMKSMFQADRKEYAQAEQSLDKAILQSPKVASLYVNRALVRYNQDNLRGAMSDYDTAIEIAPNSYLAHYNRGLLRANVGEDNLAIEDLNYILKVEPDNTIVLYNRALLLDNIGDYKGAIRDISAVIKDYPEFWEGYRKRAEIRRKVGDVYGAERDEFKILKAQMAVATGTYKSPDKTRKKSEHNIDDYDKLVEEDTHENDIQYVSEYRGKVQNKQTELKPEPLYIFTYYKNPSDVRLYVAYSKELDKMNTRSILHSTLYLTSDEGNMTESQLNAHLSSITETTSAIGEKGLVKELLFKRALDYYHVRDFENGIADMDSYVLKYGDDVLSLMLRAQCRYAQLEVSSATTQAADLRLGYLMVLQDYNRALDIQPQSPYLNYNVGCMMIKLADYSGAINAFSKAIELDSHFPEAYYSRGVAYILNGKLSEGLSDLSQAGEFGLYSAYNLIKKYSNEKK